MARATQAAWEERLARWRKSGQSAEEFAAREGVKPTALKWWRWKLSGEKDRGSRKGRARPSFIEVEAAPASSSAESRIEVVLANGRVVRVLGRFADEELVRVIALAERAR